MADAKDFLSPKSMMTPGIAGGLTVSVSMPIAVQFGLSFKWIALVVSLILSLVVVLQFDEVKSNILKGLYIVINALIIFSVSMGAGITIDPPPELPSIAGGNLSESTEISRYFNFLFSSSAYADEHAVQVSRDVEDLGEEDGKPAKAKGDERINEELRKENEMLRNKEKAMREQKEKIRKYQMVRESYDKRWSW